MSKVLEVVNEALESIGINYEYGEWTGDIVYPYYVGEYQEVPSPNEDGMHEQTFILNGFTRESLLELEASKEKIAAHFSKVGGHRVTTDTGSVVTIFYSHGTGIPTGDSVLKRVQINLTVKEWRVI